MTDQNPLAMSDEEFLRQGIPQSQQPAPEKEPPASEEQPPKEDEQKQEEQQEEKTNEEEQTNEEKETSSEPPNDAANPDPEKPEPKPQPEAEKGKPDTVSKPKDGSEAKKDEPENKNNEGGSEKPDYEAFYKQIMQPIKANGKTIELKSPEEVIRLIQMGAGYNKKLQELQPAVKTFRMLEKANLLDENSLSYLIDLHNKNPEAIKKLIKESGIDPLDLNPGDNVAYVPGNHSVSNQEMAFNDVLSEIQSREGGQETLNTINQTWDQKSIQLAWENPEILQVIQDQRESGFYPIISAEIDRQKTLGHIPNNTPFLVAYKQIGDHLDKAGAFNHLKGQTQQGSPQTASPPKPQPQVIAKRPGTVKAPVANGDKAKAAAPTSTGTKKAEAVVNPLAMSDEQFMKQFQNR